MMIMVFWFQARHYVDDEKEVEVMLASLAAATRLEMEKERCARYIYRERKR